MNITNGQVQALYFTLSALDRLKKTKAKTLLILAKNVRLCRDSVNDLDVVRQQVIKKHFTEGVFLEGMPSSEACKVELNLLLQEKTDIELTAILSKELYLDTNSLKISEIESLLCIIQDEPVVLDETD